MSYSTDIAKLVAGQLSRFVTLNRHQLAGQVANLDFWLAQVPPTPSRGSTGTTRGSVRLHAAQEHYVGQHGTTEFVLGRRGLALRGPRLATCAPPRAGSGVAAGAAGAGRGHRPAVGAVPRGGAGR